MADNYFKGKYYQGTFANGQGPVSGVDTNMEKENSGLLTGGEGGGKGIKTMDGPAPFMPPVSGGDKNFSLQGKSYAGPQNWQPADHGVSNPFDINKG